MVQKMASRGYTLRGSNGLRPLQENRALASCMWLVDCRKLLVPNVLGE
jgi:hypothetical protein